jgi:hypothetical protein
VEIKLTLIFVLVIVFSNFVSAGVVINEIMYNPEGSDNNKEYIEVFSDGFVNLTDYIIKDAVSSDSLTALQYYDSSYSLIVEEDFDYSGIDASVYSVGATIGNNLNNEEDIIIFMDNGSNVLDAIHYYNSWGGDNNGKSLCKRMNGEGFWQECMQSPGYENSESYDYSNYYLL